MKGAALALLLVLPMAAGGSAAQRFRSGVDVVTVDALVTQAARAVTGLKVEDFQVIDHGPSIPLTFDCVRE